MAFRQRIEHAAALATGAEELHEMCGLRTDRQRAMTKPVRGAGFWLERILGESEYGEVGCARKGTVRNRGR